MEITASNLPFELTFFWNRVRYVHQPSNPYNVSSTDSFMVKFFDGVLYSQDVKIDIDIIMFNEVPVLKARNMTRLTVEEESSVTFAIGFLDFDSVG